jgi:DNA-binding IclR family transcriptional regulator
MQQAGSTLRRRVLAIIEAADTSLTGAEIAHRSGLSYRQTIDALNALHNAGKIERTGRKFTARWQIARPRTHDTSAVMMLQDIFLRLGGIKQ